MVSESTKYK